MKLPKSLRQQMREYHEHQRKQAAKRKEMWSLFSRYWERCDETV